MTPLPDARQDSGLPPGGRIRQPDPFRRAARRAPGQAQTDSRPPAGAPRTPSSLHAPRSAALVLAGGILLGSAGTAGSCAPTGAGPIALGGLRLAVGALALTAALPLLGGSWAGQLRLMQRRTVWVMAVATALFQPLFFGAIARAGVAVSTLLAVGAVPVFAGLVGWVALAHRPTRTWATATLVAVGGLVLRSWGQLAVGDSLGVLMALTAAFCVGCYVVAAKTELDRGAHAVALPAAAYLLGSLLLTPLILRQPLRWLATPSGTAVVLYLGVATMALGNLVTIRGMRHLPPGPAATLMLTDPVTATVLGVLVLGEAIPPVGAVGLVLVLVGLALQARALRPTSPWPAGRRYRGDP